MDENTTFGFMICFPNAKINLGLHVLEKRRDGYHNIETLIYPLPFYDVLEILRAKEYRITVHGEMIPENENLITNAWQVIKKQYNIPAVAVHLLKNIPIGAGLGGGSSDAAGFIMALNKEFSLGLSPVEMEKTAFRTGSDSSFFIGNRPAIVSGRGEKTDPLDFSLKGKYIVLVLPDISISTLGAYAGIKPFKAHKPLRETILNPVESWKDELINDFEKTIFINYPELEKIKKILYDAGADYASLSGSGSAVFGIFNFQIHNLKLNSRWKIFPIR